MTEIPANINDEIVKEAAEAELLPETEPKSENQEAGCSKPKRRRRGKKRRNKSQDNDDYKGSDQSGNIRIERNSKHNEGRKRQKLLIRPTDVPKAPENSTQFIIDDHDECHLYFSFETPNPYKENAGSDSNDAFNDAALQDIDYKYESMQDLDNTAYYLQDFELSYSKVRYEETMRLTKPDLVTALENLEVRVRELEHKMYEKDPGSALEQLQRKLLRLQEENVTLREEQQHLRKTVVGEDSGSDELLHDSESEHLHNSDDEHDMNELSYESSDAFSASDDNEDGADFMDSDNEHSYDDNEHSYDDNEHSYDDNEFVHNSDSNESVSSVIYGLHQEYDDHSDTSQEYEDDDELPFHNDDSENSQFPNISNEHSQNSIPNNHHKDFENEPLENGELSNNFSQEKSYNLNEELLDTNGKNETYDSEQSEQNFNNKQLKEGTEEQLQVLVDAEQSSSNKNLSGEQLPDSSNSEVLLKLSNCQLDNLNDKQLQNNCNKHFKSSDNCDEKDATENSDKESQEHNKDLLENVTSERLQNFNS